MCPQDEGMKGLFTGAGPTVVRAMALNMGMLASNDQVRAGGRGPCCWCMHHCQHVRPPSSAAHARVGPLVARRGLQPPKPGLAPSLGPQPG